ncbi:hypothetical protein GF324_08660 [bacterium]|nr:hypothetical protein [bacterium]
MRNAVILLSVLVLLFSHSNAAILEVPQSHGTIQSAVDASAAGDTILISAGTYFENIVVENHELYLTSMLLLEDSSSVESTILAGDTLQPQNRIPC